MIEIARAAAETAAAAIAVSFARSMLLIRELNCSHVHFAVGTCDPWISMNVLPQFFKLSPPLTQAPFKSQLMDYLKKNWIAILALIISILALLQSIGVISLPEKNPGDQRANGNEQTDF
ncbi:MAG: hypothetical protein HFF17_07515 [Oscillospiraceae bacterium]|nr:hypothetical protein [Oscillospiraceae bacterium]